jgi:2-iminobutanoate/2-iminopropanoate deaminase
MSSVLSDKFSQKYTEENAMNRTVIQTQAAPQAIGPYSQAIQAGNLLFVSGQLPMDPITGDLNIKSIGDAVDQCLRNIEAILKQSGCTLASIVKTTVFLTNMADFNAFNEQYGQYFPNSAPARSCIQVAALPRESPLEIEVIAMT